VTWVSGLIDHIEGQCMRIISNHGEVSILGKIQDNNGLINDSKALLPLKVSPRIGLVTVALVNTNTIEAFIWTNNKVTT